MIFGSDILNRIVAFICGEIRLEIPINVDLMNLRKKLFTVTNFLHGALR